MDDLDQLIGTKLTGFKNSQDLQTRLSQLASTLQAARNSPYKNNAFFSNLTEVGTLLDLIRKQVDKYVRANALKKKMIGSDVRHKLRNLEHSLSF